MKKNKIVAALLGLTLTLSVTQTAFAKKSKDQYAGVGSYMGFIQCQTSTWVFRNNFDEANTGFGKPNFNKVWDNESKSATKTVVEDTKIDGDGDYMVSLKKLDLKGSKDFNMLGISTNIPVESKIKVTKASLTYDNTEVTQEFTQKNDDKQYVHIMLINQYDDAVKGKVNNAVPAEGTTISIRFTVTGFGYEKKVKDNLPKQANAPKETPKSADSLLVDNAPAKTPTQSPAAVSEDNTNMVWVVVGIVAAVVIIGGVVTVVVRKRKK